jgi:phytoene/squalene synthetase
VSRDYGRGRIYLPLEDLSRFGVAEADIPAQKNTARFRDLIRFEVQRTRDWFRRGYPLVGKVDRKLAIDLELFTRGGEAVLSAIEHQNYSVLGRRPAISKLRKLSLLARAFWGNLT